MGKLPGSAKSAVKTGNNSNTSANKPVNFTRKTFNSTGRVPNLSKPSPDSSDCCLEEKIDKSQVNFAYDIRINGFTSLLNTVHKSNEKVRRLILEECDFILECRVCRNLFRSLPNFIAHKQSFCDTNYNPALGNESAAATWNKLNTEIEFHYDEQASASSSGNDDGNGSKKKEKEYKQPLNKQERLNQVIQKLRTENGNASSGNYASDILDRRDYDQKSTHTSPRSILDTALLADSKTHVLLHYGGGSEGMLNRVMFQQKIDADFNSSYYRGDYRNVLETDSAVLGPDGKIICVSDASVINAIVKHVAAQVGEHHDTCQKKVMELVCDECCTWFPTKKTLRTHMRTAHRKNPQGQGLESVEKGSKQEASCNSESDHIVEENDLRTTIELGKKSSGLITQFSPPKLNTLLDHRNGITSQGKNCRVGLQKLVPTAEDNSDEDFPNRKRRSSSSNSSCGDGDGHSASVKISKRVHHGPNGVYFESLSSSSTDDEGFLCTRCSSTFSTKSDIATHLVHCVGVINLAFSERSSSNLEAKKVGILIRNDYVQKSQPPSSAACPSEPLLPLKNDQNSAPSKSESSITTAPHPAEDNATEVVCSVNAGNDAPSCATMSDKRQVVHRQTSTKPNHKIEESAHVVNGALPIFVSASGKSQQMLRIKSITPKIIKKPSFINAETKTKASLHMESPSVTKVGTTPKPSRFQGHLKAKIISSDLNVLQNSRLPEEPIIIASANHSDVDASTKTSPSKPCNNNYDVAGSKPCEIPTNLTQKLVTRSDDSDKTVLYSVTGTNTKKYFIAKIHSQHLKADPDRNAKGCNGLVQVKLGSNEKEQRLARLVQTPSDTSTVDFQGIETFKGHCGQDSKSNNLSMDPKDEKISIHLDKGVNTSSGTDKGRSAANAVHSSSDSNFV